MSHKFTLLITKTEYTLNGVNLDQNERWSHMCNPRPLVVRHFTILHQQEYKTGKAAWAAATPELIDQLGLVYNGISYSNDYASYSVNVIRSDKVAEQIAEPVAK